MLFERGQRNIERQPVAVVAGVVKRGTEARQSAHDCIVGRFGSQESS
jgi:hypothetical protein